MLNMEVEDSMSGAIDHFSAALVKIRAGKANPEMLSGVQVEAYGSTSPLNAVATVNTPDARSLIIKPFDRGTMQNIEKAIINSNLGFNPQNDGLMIRISIPPLTAERRQQLVKMAKAELETAKVSIRNARKDGMEGIKKLVKDGLSEDIGKDAEAAVQSLTDGYVKKIEALYETKEKDILTV